MEIRQYIYNDQVAYPWFAPAGEQRGVIQNATSVGYVDDEDEFVSVSLSEGQRDILYLNGINPIKISTSGAMVNWGQKTRSPTANSKLSRVNVARLSSYLRYRLDQLVQPFFFQQNDAQTRGSVKTVIDSFLAEIVTLRGITDYIVVCDSSNNTSDRVDRNELWIDIAISPTTVAEYILIPIRFVNTGDI
jgi:phage tail sheath protein FI